MSKNKDLINLLKNIKHNSFSKIDMKYNEIFKEFNVDTLIEHNNFSNQVRKKWSNNDFGGSSKPQIKTTNDKLNKIINSNKNASKIQDIFFKTFDKEPLFKKIIKKDNEKIKTNNNNNIALKIKNLIENRKKFNVSTTFLKRRYEENNRQPPICLYTPKYSYIYKRIPGFNFHKEKTTSRKKINIDNNYKINISLKNNNYDENDYNIRSKIYDSKLLKKVNSSLTPLHISKKRVHLSLIDDNSNKEKKESEENKDYVMLNKHQNNFFLSQQCSSPLNNEAEKKIQFDYSPKIMKKKVFVPNFDKMMPRFLDKSRNAGISSNIDYNPNYNAIFTGVLNNKPVDLERRRKYYNLKKIISIFNPTSEYLLFPELNKKE